MAYHVNHRSGQDPDLPAGYCGARNYPSEREKHFSRPWERTALEDQSLAVQLSAKRSEMMVQTVEAVALRLFEQRGFGAVTVEEIAAEAKISTRTFYRYLPTKDDVLQVVIDRRSEALRVTLEARPDDEPPLHSLRRALESVFSAEDPVAVRRWITVVQATPSVLKAVVGGISAQVPTGHRRVLRLETGAAGRCPRAHHAGRGSGRCHHGRPHPVVLLRRGPGHYRVREPRGPRDWLRFRSEHLE